MADHDTTGAWRGRTAALATLHEKGRVIARACRVGLGLHVRTVAVDTDALGTFTGEVLRDGDMLSVALHKARLGMTASGLPLGMASEGSFGPHPVIPFLPVATELMVYVDDERGLMLHELLHSPRTNYAHRVVTAADNLGPWLQSVGFPAHALIVQPALNEAPVAGDASITKGVRDAAHLRRAIRRATAESPNGRAFVQTDMRAHCNPTRMRVIGALAIRLVRRLRTPCPSCFAPGWGRTGVVRGLPCHGCGRPTERVVGERFTCSACPYEMIAPRQDGLTGAPPGDCPSCNP